jgi:RNA polymerase sigma-70 factor, ECF subfamily
MRQLTHEEQVQSLLVKNISQIKGFILGLVPDFSAADDVLQEVCLVITRQAQTFEIGTDFKAWARSIARLKVKEYLRQKQKLPFTLSEETVDAVASAAEEEDHGWETRRQALADCLKSIAPKAKKMMELRYEQGLPPPEIAKSMEWSLGAVNVQLSRVREFLRNCVSRKLAMEDQAT